MELSVGIAEHIVEETFLVVPKLKITPADVLHRLADEGVVLEELGGEALVSSVFLGQLERDVHHVDAEERHPTGAIGLLENRAVGELFAAVDHCDVVQSKEAALEDVVTLAIHLVDPPREIDEQLMEAFLQKLAVGIAGTIALDLVNPPDRPGMHRRIEIREFPFVGRDLSIGVLKLLEQEEPDRKST